MNQVVTEGHQGLEDLLCRTECFNTLLDLLLVHSWSPLELSSAKLHATGEKFSGNLKVVEK
jgi:hypothetical protein